jgi:2-methylcitrate dehydratase PrpD
MNETRVLAESLVSMKYSDLNTEVIKKAKQLILDNLGCQLAFSVLPWSKLIYQYVQDKQGGKGSSTVTCYGLKTIAEDAAFANATFGHGFEMDDDESHTTSHPGVVIIPAALAVGEAQGVSGKELLVAVVAGYDSMLRVGIAARTMVNRSFHTTAVLGPFGSAAATAKILGLNQDLMLNALSIAASEAGGISEYAVSGGSVKRLHAGFASQNGVKAAILAKLGVTGPAAPIEGTKGICQAFANEYYPEEITRELGREYRILWTGHKPYCCCQGQHSTIDTVSEIMAEHPFQPEDVSEIVVEQMPRDVRAVGIIKKPVDITSAQFSGSFGIALRIIKRGNGFREYNLKNIQDSELLEFAKKVTYVNNFEMEKLPPGAAPTKITLKLKNGQVYTKRIDYAKGMPQNPLTPREIETKFLDLATTVIPVKQANEIINAVNNLEDMANIRSLIEIMAVSKSKV